MEDAHEQSWLLDKENAKLVIESLFNTSCTIISDTSELFVYTIFIEPSFIEVDNSCANAAQLDSGVIKLTFQSTPFDDKISFKLSADSSSESLRHFAASLTRKMEMALTNISSLSDFVGSLFSLINFMDMSTEESSAGQDDHTSSKDQVLHPGQQTITAPATTLPCPYFNERGILSPKISLDNPIISPWQQDIPATTTQVVAEPVERQKLLASSNQSFESSAGQSSIDYRMGINEAQQARNEWLVMRDANSSMSALNAWRRFIEQNPHCGANIVQSELGYRNVVSSNPELSSSQSDASIETQLKTEISRIVCPTRPTGHDILDGTRGTATRLVPTIKLTAYLTASSRLSSAHKLPHDDYAAKRSSSEAVAAGQLPVVFPSENESANERVINTGTGPPLLNVSTRHTLSGTPIPRSKGSVTHEAAPASSAAGHLLATTGAQALKSSQEQGEDTIVSSEVHPRSSGLLPSELLIVQQNSLGAEGAFSASGAVLLNNKKLNVNFKTNELQLNTVLYRKDIAEIAALYLVLLSTLLRSEMTHNHSLIAAVASKDTQDLLIREVIIAMDSLGFIRLAQNRILSALVDRDSLSLQQLGAFLLLYIRSSFSSSRPLLPLENYQDLTRPQVSALLFSPDACGAGYEDSCPTDFRMFERSFSELPGVRSAFASLDSSFRELPLTISELARIMYDALVAEPKRVSPFSNILLNAAKSTYLTEFTEHFVLGRGGYGEVCCATKNLVNMRFAVKKILVLTRKSDDDNSETLKHAIENILEEVHILIRVQSQYVVRYYNAWLEEVEGKSASQLMVKTAYEDRMENRGDSGFGVTASSLQQGQKRDSLKSLLPTANQDGAPASVGDESSSSSYYYTYESDSESSGPHSLLDPSSAGIDLVDATQTSPTGSLSKTRSLPFRIDSLLPRRLVLFIQMEYCPNETLKEYILKGLPLTAPVETLWEMCIQMFRGIRDIHSKNIIHYDIKTGNIFLDEYCNIKIGDFGVSRLLRETDVQEEEHQRGTPSYMAPEVFNPRLFSEYRTKLKAESYGLEPSSLSLHEHELILRKKADIYSLGVVFAELWFCPQNLLEQNELYAAIDQGQLPAKFVESHRAQALLIRKMTNKDPFQRPTIEELLNDKLIPPIEHSAGELLTSLSSAFKHNMLNTTDKAALFTCAYNNIFKADAVLLFESRLAQSLEARMLASLSNLCPQHSGVCVVGPQDASFFDCQHTLSLGKMNNLSITDHVVLCSCTGATASTIMVTNTNETVLRGSFSDVDPAVNGGGDGSSRKPLKPGFRETRSGSHKMLSDEASTACHRKNSFPGSASSSKHVSEKDIALHSSEAFNTIRTNPLPQELLLPYAKQLSALNKKRAHDLILTCIRQFLELDGAVCSYISPLIKAKSIPSDLLALYLPEDALDARTISFDNPLSEHFMIDPSSGSLLCDVSLNPFAAFYLDMKGMPQAVREYCAIANTRATHTQQKVSDEREFTEDFLNPATLNIHAKQLGQRMLSSDGQYTVGYRSSRLCSLESAARDYGHFSSYTVIRAEKQTSLFHYKQYTSSLHTPLVYASLPFVVQEGFVSMHSLLQMLLRHERLYVLLEIHIDFSLPEFASFIEIHKTRTEARRHSNKASDSSKAASFFLELLSYQGTVTKVTPETVASFQVMSSLIQKAFFYDPTYNWGKIPSSKKHSSLAGSIGYELLYICDILHMLKYYLQQERNLEIFFTMKYSDLAKLPIQRKTEAAARHDGHSQPVGSCPRKMLLTRLSFSFHKIDKFEDLRLLNNVALGVVPVDDQVVSTAGGDERHCAAQTGTDIGVLQSTIFRPKLSLGCILFMRSVSAIQQRYCVSNIFSTIVLRAQQSVALWYETMLHRVTMHQADIAGRLLAAFEHGKQVKGKSLQGNSTGWVLLPEDHTEQVGIVLEGNLSKLDDGGQKLNALVDIISLRQFLAAQGYRTLYNLFCEACCPVSVVKKNRSPGFDVISHTGFKESAIYVDSTHSSWRTAIKDAIESLTNNMSG